MSRFYILFTIIFSSFYIHAQWSPILSVPSRGITEIISGQNCTGNNPAGCTTYNVSGMNWYLTAPNLTRPISLTFSQFSVDYAMTRPNGFFEWEDPDGLLCINSEVINIASLGSVQMNFGAEKFGPDMSATTGHVNFGYRVNGGLWVNSQDFSVVHPNIGGTWTTNASGNTLEIRACADFSSDNQDVRLTVFNTNLGGPLPVKWSEFFLYATKAGHFQLNWQTSSEVNNHYFEVERSLDGNYFSAIGRVKGSGNRSTATNYQFLDENTENGITYYYRIKQVDFDGTTDYSIILDLKISSDEFNLTVSPNPVENLLRIEMNNISEKNIQLKIYNMSGQNMRTIYLHSDQNLVETDISDLPPGAYYINSSDVEIKPRRFIKTGQ